MNNYIKSIYIEKTESVTPGTSTDLANSLDLLSSGIYTEEERFVFELLQNAVDAYNNEDETEKLSIKIAIVDEFVIFMHNGETFSKRDIEGICSVGNGDKTKNLKKIGYKGIGFKSVFMHSNNVTIKSGNIYFSFEKEYWDDFFGNNNKSNTGRRYKMPWQIIPILKFQPPIACQTKGYNVVTYIKMSDPNTLASKIKGLMSDCQFLLFLRHNNIEIECIIDDCKSSVSKRSVTLRNINDATTEQKVVLYVNDEVNSQWLVYKNENVKIPNSVQDKIQVDTKTPQKLQNVTSFDLSIAVSLDENEHLKALEQSVIYTYLPTSCTINLPFIVNANFITDAGRQQLNIDSVWNRMVISSIPQEFLKWIASLSLVREDYYKIVRIKSLGIKGFEEKYQKALARAIETIPFIPNSDKTKLGHTEKPVFRQRSSTACRERTSRPQLHGAWL